jgi:hypothetical protein
MPNHGSPETPRQFFSRPHKVGRAAAPRHLQLESLERRELLTGNLPWGTYEFRSIDGSGNNLEHPDWGAAGTALLRMMPASYMDGKGEMMVEVSDRANPRTISNRIAAQGDQSIVNDRQLSDFIWQWGQFLDHDLSLTHADAVYGHEPIPMPEGGDPLFGYQDIPFRRSEFALDDQSTRQQINQLTAFIDASNVYGSDPERAAGLRTFEGGRLRQSDNGLLPLNSLENPLPNDGEIPGSPMFVAGDSRANEQVALTSMHTLFVREHNRLAELIARHDPKATDEQIYQLARKLVGAEMQIITYEEFLPALLGHRRPSAYMGSGRPGYDATMSPSIANEFSAALFRVGHSMLSPQLLLVEGKTIVGELPLKEAFFRPDFLKNDPQNLERVLRGLATQRAQEIDNKIIDDVRNFLFGPPGSGGMDLVALNIQRGRDHGLPDYNSLRAAYGLPRVTDFRHISSNREVQNALRELYVTVDNIDPWVGALAEDHVPGASVGPLMHTALSDQFDRLRDGDRFFYQHDRSLRHASIRRILRLEQVSLSQIIRWNTQLDDMPRDVFRVRGPAATVAAPIISPRILVSALLGSSSQSAQQPKNKPAAAHDAIFAQMFPVETPRRPVILAP